MDPLLSLDSALLSWVASLPHSSALDTVMIGASGIGAKGTVWIVLGFVLAVWRPRAARGFWQLVLAVVLTFLVVDGLLKPWVGRGRPSRVDSRFAAVIEPPNTASFPSGHAASSFAGAFALARLIPRVRLALWALAALIAFSRVYLGVHYPFDVVAGALVGLGCAAFAVGGTVWYIEGPSVRVSHVPR